MCCFAIRDILWLTLMVGMALGWWSERSHGKKLADQYSNLACQVRWCPPGMHIVCDESGEFRLEGEIPEHDR